MNKLRTCLAALLLTLGSYLPSHAQFDPAYLRLDVGAHLNGYLKEINQLNPGANLRLSYDVSEFITLATQFSYGIPLTVLTDGTEPISGTTFNAEQKYNFMNAHLMMHYYFINDNEDDFGAYGTLGLGYALTNSTYKMTLTGAPIELSAPITHQSPLGLLGAGFQTNLEWAYLFGEAGFNLALGGKTETNLPASFWTVSAGLRFNLGER